MSAKPPCTSLSVVGEFEQPYARAQRLQAEAFEAITQHIGTTLTALTRAADACAEVAAGGELYPAAVRDRARRLAEQIASDRDGMDIAFQTALAANHRRTR